MKGVALGVTEGLSLGLSTNVASQTGPTSAEEPTGLPPSLAAPVAFFVSLHIAVVFFRYNEPGPELAVRRKERKEMFYLTTHSTHFIYGYMVSDIW